MDNPAAITKIEQTTEAIESLTLATVAHMLDLKNEKLRETLKDARADVADALRALLTPTLRVTCVERVDRVGDATTTLRKFISEPVTPGGETDVAFGVRANRPVHPGHKDICTSDRCHCGPQ